MKFVDPPTIGKLRYLTTDLQERLRANPDQWALVMEKATPNARAAIHRYCSRHPYFETTVRSAGRGDDDRPQFDIYVRFNSRFQS